MVEQIKLAFPTVGTELSVVGVRISYFIEKLYSFFSYAYQLPLKQILLT